VLGAIADRSNTTDLNDVGCEPGATVRWTTSTAEMAADLVGLPESRATARDLQGDAVACLTDTNAIERLITKDIPAGRPFIAPRATGGRA
jgi:cobyric acid synthase